MLYVFLSAGDSTVRANFLPTNPDEYGMSWDTVGMEVTVVAPPPPPPITTTTTTTVTGPTSAKVGTPATLAASVSPASAAGTVQFSVGGSPVASPAPGSR